LGNGLALLSTSQRQPAREDYGVIRIDHHLTSKDDIFARYVFDDSNAIVPFINTFVPGFAGQRDYRNQYFILNWQRLVKPTLLNELKFNFNRTRFIAKAANSYPISISLTPNRDLGAIDIAGLPALGNNAIFPIGTTSNLFEVIDNATWQHGNQSIKFGIDIKRMQINGAFDGFVNGNYSFADLSPFGVPVRSNNPALESFLQAQPLVYVGVDPSASDSTRGYRQSYFAGYLQDDFHVNEQLTLNLGLRWEYFTNPGEANNRLANIRNVVTDTMPTVGKLFDSVPADLFSPRFGFAWLPRRDGKTVIRGGAAILRDQFWANLYFDTRFYEPFYRPLLYILPNFQTPPTSTGSLIGLGGPPQVLGGGGITFKPDFPYYIQYNFNIQQAITPNLLIQAAYVGSRGNHLVRQGEANPLVGALGSRINPNFGAIPLIVTDAQSFYNSAQLSLQKRFSNGLSFQASYTYSKSIDDASGAFQSDFSSESGIAQNFFDRKGDRGLSSFDRRHAFVFNYLYELPFGKGHRYGNNLKGLSAKLVTGWNINGIASLLSGPPFTANLGAFNNSNNFALFPADRPDIKPNANTCGSGKTANQWFDPTIFTLAAPGSYGNAGRNILCGPSLMNFDLSLVKMMRVNERLSVQFRAEFFNLFNNVNLDVPVNTQGPNGNGGNGDAIFIGRRSDCNPATDPLGCGILAPNAGRIFRTSTPSRQIQFVLKLIY
jgi:hypothetical protein